MNTKHEFCDHCPGCRPILVDSDMKPIADDNPAMIIVNKVWNNDTTYDMRKAFIEVTLHNSQNKTDLSLASQVVDKFKRALESAHL